MKNMFKFDLQLFGGGGGGTTTTVQKVEVAPATAEERRLQAELKGYQDAGLAGAKELQERGLEHLRHDLVEPDYKALLDEWNRENDRSTAEYTDEQNAASERLESFLEAARAKYGDKVAEAIAQQAAGNDRALAEYTQALKDAQTAYEPESKAITDEYNSKNEAYANEYADAAKGFLKEYNDDFHKLSEYHDADTREALDEYKRDSKEGLQKHEDALNQYLNDYEDRMKSAQQQYESRIAIGEGRYNNIENPAYERYLKGMDEVEAGMKDVANGVIPEAYTQARRQALQDDLNHSTGSLINDMAKRGIINSSVTSSGLDSINQSVSDTLAKNYSADLAQQAGLLKDRGSLLKGNYDVAHGKAAYERDSANALATTGLKNATDFNNNLFNSKKEAANDQLKIGQDVADKILTTSTKISDDIYNRSSKDYQGFFDTRMAGAKSIYDTMDAAAKNRYATNLDALDKRYAHSNDTAQNIYGNTTNNNNNKAKSLMDAAASIYNGTQADAQNIYNAQNATSTNNFNARQLHMQSKLTGALQNQAGSYYSASRMLDMANQLYQPSQTQYNVLYNGRHGAATTTTTSTSSGGNDGMMGGLFGAIGTVGSALVTCFAAGTQVTTPTGYKNIEDIKVGDEVLSLDENNNVITAKVKEVLEPHMADTITVQWDNSTRWRTTINQRFYDGSHFAYFSCRQKAAIAFQGLPTRIINFNEGPTELVYDFVVDNSINVFFANDVAAEGYGD